jgi:ABC-type branched-subunit amino acid transport system ATPase component
MTALENLLVGKQQVNKSAVKKAIELLDFFGITKLKDEKAKNLSYGQKKLLELARILMRDPEVLLLDEPAAGINPVLIEKMLDHIKQLRRSGKTIIVVEHNISFISDICDKVMVLDEGQKIAEGRIEEIQKDVKVIDAFLGSV